MDELRRSHYDKHYQKDMFSVSNKYDKLLGLLRDYSVSVFLDVGCGDGSFASAVQRELQCKSYGIDISQDAADSAQKNGVKAFQLDIDSEDFPFESLYFDCVFCGEIIEHLYYPDHLLREVHRVLRPGGILLLTTPNMASWFNRISILLGFQPIFSDVGLERNFGHLWEMEPMGHLRLFTYRSIMGLIDFHGFTVIATRGIGMNPLIGFGRKHAYLVRVTNRVFRGPAWNSGILILARKK